MNKNDKKEALEMMLFKEFLKHSELMIDPSSIGHGDPDKGEPDILCEYTNGAKGAFEMTEACCPEFYQAISNITDEDNGVVCAWGGDVTDITVMKKLKKSYSVQCPVDLLVYVNGMTAATFQILKVTILPILTDNVGPFQKVWLMTLDDERAEVIYPPG